MLSATLWIPSATWIVALLFLVMYVPLALSGAIRNGAWSSWLISVEGDKPKRRVHKNGAAGAIMQGLANGRSALLIITAGLIVGALMALLIICVLDVIKPQQVWTETVLRSTNDVQVGANMTKEFAVSRGFDGEMFVRLLTWIGLPLLVIVVCAVPDGGLQVSGGCAAALARVPADRSDRVYRHECAGDGGAAESRQRARTGHRLPSIRTPSRQEDDGEYNNIWIIASWVIGMA